MKNKLFIILLNFIFIFISNLVYALEEFYFESQTIEILKSNNEIFAEGNVKATTTDGVKIYADKSRYLKDLNKLELFDNVIFIDEINDIELKSQNILYFKDSEKIISKDNTKINFLSSYKIFSSNITFQRDEMEISSKEETTLKDNLNNKITLYGFHLSLNDKILKSNKIKFKDEFENIYNTNEAIINIQDKKIVAKDIEVYLNSEGGLGGNARIKGSSMISENNITEINNGIFTTCKPNDNCTPWSIKSKKIYHDKNKRIINYDDSVMQLYDFPVAYFPKFFHPDPTVKRQSGFLTPSLINSSSLGNSLNIPYYKVLSENKDFTFSPRIYFNNDILLQNEYRQEEKRSSHISDFSFKKLTNNSKSHFFSNTKFRPNDNLDYSELEFNLETTSNDTYLKKNKIKSNTRNVDNQSLLSSYIKYEASNNDLKFNLETLVYEDLNQTNDSDKYQYILPSFSLSKRLDTSLDLNGDLNYQISGSNRKRETNINETILINDFTYLSNSFFSKYGSVTNYEILFKNTTKNGKNSEKYENEVKTYNYTLGSISSSIPLNKKYGNYSLGLKPKMMLNFSPNNSENNKGLDRKITSTNLFSSNRLALNESIEGGKSLTIGFDYNMNKDSDEIFNLSIGQIFRDINDKRLPVKSTMQNKTSDIVGSLEIKPNDIFNLGYEFSADNNLELMNFSKINTSINVNNFITNFEFLEENNDIGSNSYFATDLKYSFNKSNFIGYNTRRNRKTNLTEFYNLIYEYKNDCLVAAIEYNKDYYQDRDLEPNEEIFFKLTITPLTSVNSPNFK